MSELGSSVCNDACDSVWNRRFLILIASVFLWKIFFIWIFPLSVDSEEAYYYNWSRIVELGYFSKPPMIAWINAVTRSFGNVTPFVLRIPSVILAVVTVCAVFALARRMFNAKTGFFAVLLIFASTAGCVIGVPMTTDAPLLCFWALSLYSFWRVIESDKNYGRWFFATALFIGLGTLAKQMMLVTLILMPLCLAVSKEQRRKLKSPHLYVMIIIGLAFLIPVLYWNSQNDWPTVHHTAEHFNRGGDDGKWYDFLKTSGDFIGGQLGFISPVSWFLFVAVSVALTFRRFFVKNEETVKKNYDVRIVYLLLVSFLPLLCFFLMSFRQKINANWPIIYYLPAMILLAAWGVRSFDVAGKVNGWRKAFVPGLWIGGMLAVLTSVYTVAGSYHAGFGKGDPLYRFRGWQSLAVQVDELIEKEQSSEKVFLLADNRHILSQLSFNMKDQPHLYIWTNQGGLHSQYDLWNGPNDKLGWDCIYISKYGIDHQADKVLLDSFDSYREIGTLKADVGGGKHRSVNVIRFSNLKKWSR